MDEQQFLAILGNKVFLIRKSLGLSQSELAKKLGTKHPAIRRIEKGEMNLTVHTIFKLAKALGVEVDELIKVN